ncbi:MAG: UDP-N-acetylmuramyl peptide synthase [Methanobrevibacter sp.]|uniref:Mur ligase family protein n=1 Tax=Methanobrevibacter sp. TaxID=66852 RepID=UPI001B46A8BD|nr:Mur ligase family protein [Methanobrevibacter sp.]MBP3791413.1 UDP-N-acetylmuramyl peptide synthase [Methanobrevibacter sp.]
MLDKLRLSIAKASGKSASLLSKVGPGGGGNIPGYVFSRVGDNESISSLASELKYGSILVTGTNGKTTTTTLLIKLISQDVQIRRSYENNTIHSILTAMLKQDGDLGVFEYGIRNKEFGIPDKVQKLIDPVGVVYTTISPEHSQVNNVKNSFLAYYSAKTLLSKEMKRGVIVANCDDPRTALIGLNKEKDVHVNYFGINITDIEDFDSKPIKCPNCGEILKYSHNFLNHRGFYSCECGFKRPEPNVKLVGAELNPDSWKLSIEGDLYNYAISKNVQFSLELNVPPFGLHNIYNTLASITAYASFTPKVENIEKSVKNIFDNLDMSFIPPGRFEIISYDNKHIGIGQGDNGDAVKVNAMFIKPYCKDSVEFIFTTPDEYEDDIFRDQYEVVKSLNPDHVIVVPGRKSIDKAREYYEIIKKDFETADFYPLDYEEMDKRIEKLTELAKESKYETIIMTGCGEEQAMWESIKRNFINR